MQEVRDLSPYRAWIVAIRPQTLPAGAAPVIVGTGVAASAGAFAPGPAVAALIGALLIQIGTNFANDYYDAKRGVDGPDREGFTRVTQSGLLEPDTVKRAMWISFLAAIIVGVYLVGIGGIPIVLIGLVSVACGIAYAGGPVPFGSYGLGDLFVFVFFGPVAVVGTYYVQAVSHGGYRFPLWAPEGTVTTTVFLASVPMATLSTAILVVNNLRDRRTDRRAGKYTLAVLIGDRATRLEYTVLVVVAYVIPVWLVLRGASLPVLLPLGTVPFAVVMVWTVLTGTSGQALNRTLERTGKLLAAYAALFAVGFLL